MKVQLIGHDEKYALEQSLLTLFPDERPVYGTVEDTDARWAVVRKAEENDTVRFTTKLGYDGKTAEQSYAYPLSGTDYEREGQRRHALGLSFSPRRRTCSASLPRGAVSRAYARRKSRCLF